MKEQPIQRIGFIGLGIMGKPMARHLLQAGYPLIVHNRSRGAVQELVREGAEEAFCPREAAERSDAVLTMLPDSQDVEAVVLGAEGVAEGIRPGMRYIDMSTISPAVARRIHGCLQVQGVESLDAPVSGGEVGAREASLSFMVGGAEEVFQRALPILRAMGKNIVHVGGPGAGQVTKACNQIVVAGTIQCVAEALTMARKAGVDAARVREALLGGFAQSRILDLHGQRIMDRRFQPGFKIRLHRKDLAIALETGRELSVPLFGTAQAAALMDALVAGGRGELDHSALALLIEELAGLH